MVPQAAIVPFPCKKKHTVEIPFHGVFFLVFPSLCQALHRPLPAVHRDLHPILQGAGGANGPHNDGLVQAQPHHSGVAAHAVLLCDDADGVSDIGEHLVVGVGHHQDHAGAELLLHVLQGPADAEDALHVLIAHAGAADEAAAHQVDLNHVGGI